MPQYVVQLEGGGSMTVNASSPEAARGNVASTGNTPAGSGGGSSAPASSGGGTTNASNASAGGTQQFNTKNGLQTEASMRQQLMNVGWDGQGSVTDAYARTTGGPVTSAGTTSSPGTSPGTDGSGLPNLPGVPQVNTDLAVAQLNAGNQAALIAYYNAKLNLDSDDLAFRKAQDAFDQAVKTAGLTGTFQGQPTIPALQQYATLFGQWGVPATGQQTLAAEQQQFNQWLAAQQEARLGQTAQQQTAQAYLQLLAGLRGPADWVQYQKVLGATPGGLSDLVRAAAGQYVPARGATTGVAPQGANLQSLIGTVGQPDQSVQQAMQGLVAPNQMAPQTWNALNPSQKEMLLGAWEGQGYSREDAQSLFNQSLPRYATNAPTSGQFRLV